MSVEITDLKRQKEFFSSHLLYWQELYVIYANNLVNVRNKSYC